jgi:hypothetical protein
MLCENSETKNLKLNKNLTISEDSFIIQGYLYDGHLEQFCIFISIML